MFLSASTGGLLSKARQFLRRPPISQRIAVESGFPCLFSKYSATTPSRAMCKALRARPFFHDSADSVRLRAVLSGKIARNAAPDNSNNSYESNR
jgi:hypothetical protein